MANGALTKVAAFVQRLAPSANAPTDDRQLLQRFSQQRTEAAFAELVARHGGMVLGVSRRLLGHEQDAEDVFQATFLVLARKAGALRWQTSIANWLHGVALRLALKLRCQRARRQVVERQASCPGAAVSAESWSELRALLDTALAELPEKYRAPLVLCYLEGRARDEAAQQLGCSFQVLKGCLERGRSMLRRALARRGVTLGTGMLGLLVSEGSSAAAAALAQRTALAAASLAQGAALTGIVSNQVFTLMKGALTGMFLQQVKAAALVLFLGTVFATGAALWGTAAPVELPVLPVLGSALADATFPIATDEPREPRQKEVRARFKSADAAKGTITVELRREAETSTKDYKLARKDLEVRSSLDDKLKLADLKEGGAVSLRLTASDEVTAITVVAPSIRGFVKAVDAAASTITIGRGAESPDRVLAVARDAKITQNGKPAELKDLSAKTIALLTLSFDEKQVRAIVAGGGDREGGERPERGRAVFGKLKAVDETKKSLTLIQGGEGGDREVVYKLAEAVRVAVGEKEGGKLADLKANTPVTLLLNADKLVIGVREGRPRAEGRPALGGVIKAVDAAKNKLTVMIRGEGGAVETTFAVDKDAKIRIGDKEHKLSDLKEEMRVQLQLSADRATVVEIRSLRRDGEKE